jgi:hypothetical protein
MWDFFATFPATFEQTIIRGCPIIALMLLFMLNIQILSTKDNKYDVAFFSTPSVWPWHVAPCFMHITLGRAE